VPGLTLWYKVATKAEWHGLHSVRRDYPSADQVGTVLIFDILGGNFRLITRVNCNVHDDSHHHLPELPPHETVKHLMQQRGLKQADLVPVLGSRAPVSDLVNGKRGISKAQAKALAKYFGVAIELFL
jgi:HTH-type transcriptional regulator/antitoxin HigA